MDKLHGDEILTVTRITHPAKKLCGIPIITQKYRFVFHGQDSDDVTEIKDSIRRCLSDNFYEMYPGAPNWADGLE